MRTEQVKLKDTVAIVSGASGGIGKSIAVHLAAEGAAVVCICYSNSRKTEEVVRSVQDARGTAPSFPGRA